MEIRLAHPNEVGAIVELIEEARNFLALSGSSQWQGDYPNLDVIIEDVVTGKGYVGLVDGKLACYAALHRGREDAYDAIYDGKWQHNHSLYTTIHRVVVAAAFRGQKLVQTFLQGLIEGQKGPDFRSDTHQANQVMQHILEKLGFTYCGKLAIDGERLGYQKIKQSSEKSIYQEIAEDDRWLFTQ